MGHGKLDRVFLILTILLVSFGILAFLSASLGVLAKSETKFYGILFNQIVLGLALGSGALILFSRIPYRTWRSYAFWIFVAAVAVCLLVFVDGVGFAHNGARRWIHIGTVSFQPAELLKLAFVMYFAGWLSWVKGKVESFRYGLLPFMALVGVAAALLLKQPDTGTFMVLFAAALAMYLVSGASLRQIGILLVIVLIGASALIFTRPYLQARVMTFLNPAADPLGASYQVQQSLIAVGSGGAFGRGFGQSVQKFNYLPEPIGDSIFAVISEEFGFFGATLLILLFVAFALRGLKIAMLAPDQFGRLLATGLVILIVSQSFINIASMVGLMPLTGVPIIFISHGGTALLFALAGVGILLNISRYAKPRV